MDIKENSFVGNEKDVFVRKKILFHYPLLWLKLRDVGTFW